MKFRKKPIVIEAFQMLYQPGQSLTYEQADSFPAWFREAIRKDNRAEGSVFHHANGLFVIFTLEGLMEILPGDYVIRGTKGEIYPCKPDVFEEVYDAI